VIVVSKVRTDPVLSILLRRRFTRFSSHTNRYDTATGARGDAAKRAPGLEANLALIQAMFGENSRAISTLTQLLQTPFIAPITPALLRLDPTWDPLRSDPAFQKLCEEKQP
jgi:hypothetical protein